jgi:hypothetical protein
MDIESLKGKTLDDKMYGELAAHLSDLVSQRDAARRESIDGRKGKDAKIKEISDRLEAFAERLGVEVNADLDSLPTAKGQAEAAKQFDAQVKKLTKERDEAIKAHDEVSGRLATERRNLTISQAVGKHPFIDADDARALTSARVRQEGDAWLFEGDGGKLVPIDEGVAWLAKTKAHLVRPSGSEGGSGFKGNGGSSSAKSGDLGGDRAARVAALSGRFPELSKSS